MRIWGILGVLAVMAFAGMGEASAEGMAHPWQYTFQEAASPVMERLTSLHDYLLIVITAIVVFVMVLLLYIIVRFNRRANPVPSKVTHNTLLEIVWTTVPVLILVTIAIPTFKLIYYMDRTEEADMTLKVVGHQWYWHYQYPDQGGFEFDSYIVEDEDLKPGQVRLLEVDNRIVVPVNATVRVLGTGADVIHNFAVPALGVKMDVVPGKLNETWFRATKTGTYRGQCSELCGVRHGFMPIVIDVVTQEEFDAWVNKAQDKFSAVTNQNEMLKFAIDQSADVAIGS